MPDAPPKRAALKPRNLGRLTEAQDSALDRAARTLTRRRGALGRCVTRADIIRRALALYFHDHGLTWPA